MNSSQQRDVVLNFRISCNTLPDCVNNNMLYIDTIPGNSILIAVIMKYGNKCSYNKSMFLYSKHDRLENNNWSMLVSIVMNANWKIIFSEMSNSQNTYFNIRIPLLSVFWSQSYRQSSRLQIFWIMSKPFPTLCNENIDIVSAKNTKTISIVYVRCNA